MFPLIARGPKCLAQGLVQQVFIALPRCDSIMHSLLFLDAIRPPQCLSPASRFIHRPIAFHVFLRVAADAALSYTVSVLRHFENATVFMVDSLVTDKRIGSCMYVRVLAVCLLQRVTLGVDLASGIYFAILSMEPCSPLYPLSTCDAPDVRSQRGKCHASLDYWIPLFFKSRCSGVNL